MFKIREDLEAIHIDLPRRVSADRSRQNRMLMTVIGVACLAQFGGCLIGPLLESSGDIAFAFGLVVIGVLVMGILPYVFFVVGHRRISAAGSVALSQRMLTMKMDRREDVTIPLESVREIEIEADADDDQGRLRFQTTQGPIELFDGLFMNELEWLAALIQVHANRQRAHLVQQGHEVDAPARLPDDLIQLVRRTR